MQFDGPETGKCFIEAWKRARIIVDSGGGRVNGGTARNSGQIKSIPSKTMWPDETKTAF